MGISYRTNIVVRPLTILLSLLIALFGTQSILAQAPKMDRGPMPKMPLQIKPDPRVLPIAKKRKNLDTRRLTTFRLKSLSAA
jgi:hypothetical protein